MLISELRNLGYIVPVYDELRGSNGCGSRKYVRTITLALRILRLSLKNSCAIHDIGYAQKEKSQKLKNEIDTIFRHNVELETYSQVAVRPYAKFIAFIAYKIVQRFGSDPYWN